MLFFVTSVKFSYSSISDRNLNPTPVVTTLSTSFKAWFSSAGLQPHRAGKHERNQKQRYAEKYNRRPGKKRKSFRDKKAGHADKASQEDGGDDEPLHTFRNIFRNGSRDDGERTHEKCPHEFNPQGYDERKK
jgi:hypothetical protein